MRCRITKKDLFILAQYVNNIRDNHNAIVNVDFGIIYNQSYSNIVEVFTTNYTKKYSYYYINDNLVYFIKFDKMYSFACKEIFDLNRIDNIDDLQFTVAHTINDNYVHLGTNVLVDDKIKKLKEKYNRNLPYNAIQYYFINIVSFLGCPIYHYKEYCYFTSAINCPKFKFSIRISI